MEEIELPEEGILTNFHNYADTTLTARGYVDQLCKRQNDVSRCCAEIARSY